MSSLLEQLVFSLPKEWLDKAYDANTTGMSDGYCGSIEVIEEYIRYLESRQLKEGFALVPVEPTPAMRQIGGEYNYAGISLTAACDYAYEVYKAMISEAIKNGK